MCFPPFACGFPSRSRTWMVMSESLEAACAQSGVNGCKRQGINLLPPISGRKTTRPPMMDHHMTGLCRLGYKATISSTWPIVIANFSTTITPGSPVNSTLQEEHLATHPSPLPPSTPSLCSLDNRSPPELFRTTDLPKPSNRPQAKDRQPAACGSSIGVCDFPPPA